MITAAEHSVAEVDSLVSFTHQTLVNYTLFKADYLEKKHNMRVF